jgi:hypothetical protein
MSKYKLIQLTNNAIGEIEVDGYMPFGNITRRLNSPVTPEGTFTISTTGANIVYLNEPGYYNVIYSLSAVASAAGIVDITLTTNGTDVYAVSATATADGTVNLTLPVAVRVCPNSCSSPTNCPVGVQVQLGTTAITDGTSNMIIEKVQ